MSRFFFFTGCLAVLIGLFVVLRDMSLSNTILDRLTGSNSANAPFQLAVALFAAAAASALIDRNDAEEEKSDPAETL